MHPPDKTLDLFIRRAEAVSAVVHRVTTPREALEYTVNLCQRKDACQLLVSGCEAPLSVPAENLCETRQTRVIAAPALPGDQKADLEGLCRGKGIRMIDRGLRDHLAGIDIGLTYADFGIADTGTLVVESSSEQLRLATMICEIHVAILPRQRLRETSYDLAADLVAHMQQPPNYTAFITGASRTADIERVLALGVHGPLELHILILEEA